MIFVAYSRIGYEPVLGWLLGNDVEEIHDPLNAAEREVVAGLGDAIN
jgi:hypothetical protein